MHYAIHITYLSYKTSEYIWYDFEILIKIKHDIFKTKKKCSAIIILYTLFEPLLLKLLRLINISLSSLNSKYTIAIISKCVPRKINQILIP